ncbi:formate dehydrogenase [Roseovarius indicus]|nr:formate dehydrogenase subunit delta [Roseovarius indicus]OAO10470.1 formate dehydrogenase [Roseovarius indicus]
MSPEKMVHMANQIATFFKTQPGGNQVENVANHLTDFWDPRMRQQLRNYVDQGGEGLDDIAIGAARMIA